MLSDPLWHPRFFDPKSNVLEFVRLAPDRFASPEFLADHQPASNEDIARVGKADFVNASVQEGALHFVFHTAFCRSTLLIRALNASSAIAGMNEPGLIAALCGLGDQGKPLIAPTLRWLSRPQSNCKAVVIKPTNHANAIIPHMLGARRNSQAVIISNSLASFLASVNRRGLLGRRWARLLLLEVQRYAPLDLGLDSDGFFELSDMQVAGLSWFLQRRWLLAMMEHFETGRIATLDSDAFDDQPALALTKVATHFGLDLDACEATQIAESDVFKSHSKLGGDFGKYEERQADRGHSEVWEEEVDQVTQWLSIIAQQAGLPDALPRSLL